MEIKEIKEKIKNIKVLVVDDEPAIRKGTGDFLTKFFDNVFICDNGLDGLKTFQENPDITLVMSDIIMPQMNGMDMVTKIKEINPNIFVIFITASRGSIQEVEEMSDMYIKKPLTYDNLINILEKVSKI